MIFCEYKVDNAGRTEIWSDLKCDNCLVLMCCSWPRIDHEDKNYCGDCALKLEIIDGFQHAKTFMYFMSNPYFSEIINGIIYLYTKKNYKSKLKRIKNGSTNKRNSPEYNFFRSFVFKRDNYTCQNCGTRGTILNAHHHKSYKHNKSLRTDVSNGVTLCVECHKKEHKRIRNNALV